ncbi:IS30 family transposase [Xanthomonas campestris]|uniref:IS30 family transposase n=1 Tax=Xanthomonas campestris TaxID=339 RepID=UPI001E476290|nr:IS30 family transposase [Xanthomonas campestris]MDO0788964.1 IS30 family transposase [Xanthomonas campestris pv. campestris]MDO0838494.1 IS30 family transposase [Xanthomonas campestris pv. campestris]MEA0762130.1 IS30 family transposase [Xanthomonas campestris pv. campestris]MEA9808741.1 IS30 family transposase [Xanthomonas campestris pv. raphani]MEB1224059.1 IS30 family transposase [Xanthomonas campestris pv. campestris]
MSEHRRTQASRRLRIDAERICQIEGLLSEDFSPEQIAGRTGLASHEWIYWQIYADQKRGGQLFTHLRRRRRNRRRRGVRDGLGQLTHRHSWTRRPSVVEQRSPIGDWELDTLRASYRKAVVASMTERRSRLHLLAYSPDGTAENVRNAIVQRLYGLGHTVHTLTADNGKEFDDHQLIAACLQSDFYFADPYCAWQRGSKKMPTGRLASTCHDRPISARITDAHLRWIEQRLYNRPRKILGFKTPLEVFSEEVLNSVANQSRIRRAN